MAELNRAITPDQLSSKWGAIVSQQLLKIIELETELAEQAEKINCLTQNEAVYVEQIQDLGAEIEQLRHVEGEIKKPPD
jgi:uncharacterized coiled-coil protein SlyX